MRMPDLDTAKFILAVKRHPIIYKRNYTKYEQNRTRAWTSVCKEVFSGWDQMNAEDKYEIRQGLQKRWKSLRASFYREVNSQKQDEAKRKAGAKTRRRKKYEHFDLMSFLLKFNEVDEQGTEDSSDTLVAVKTEDIEEATNASTGSSRLVIDTDSPSTVKEYQPRYRSVNVQKKILEILQDMKKQDQDDDKQFILSLIPTFKKLNDEQKFEAKIAILNLLKNFTSGDNK